MKRTPEGLLLIGRRELGRSAAQAGLGLVATATGLISLPESHANAAQITMALETPEEFLSRIDQHPFTRMAFGRDYSWETIKEEVEIAKTTKPEYREAALVRIPYRDLFDVAAIHGGDARSQNVFDPVTGRQNWIWAPGEEGFRAILTDGLVQNPDGTISLIHSRLRLDPNTYVQGWKAINKIGNNTYPETHIVHPSQGTVDLVGAVVGRDMDPDTAFQYVGGRAWSDSQALNAQRGTDYIVVFESRRFFF